MDLMKFDELNSLIDGVHYIHYINPTKECFYYRDPFNDRGSFAKENYDFSNPYPYLVVNIGSGVSIIAGNRGCGVVGCRGGTAKNFLALFSTF